MGKANKGEIRQESILSLHIDFSPNLISREHWGSACPQPPHRRGPARSPHCRDPGRSRSHSPRPGEWPERRYIQDSHWSSSYIAGISLVESFRVLKYIHSVATPALLCHKEPAQGTQSPHWGVFRPKAQHVGGFGCLELVLYGIREMA